MKKFFLLALPLIICALLSRAQVVTASVNSKVAALKEAGIDTIIIYNPYCSGCIISGISTSDTCFHVIRRYVIWKQNGESYVQFFDECYTYVPQKGAKSFVAVLSDNFGQIEKEELLPIIMEKVVNGKIQSGTWGNLHSDHQDFVFHINKRVIEKPVDKFILTTQWVEDFSLNHGNTTPSTPPAKLLNINYEKNQNTYLKKLADLAEQEIETMKFKKAP